MDPLEVPTDDWIKVEAIKTGGIYIAKRTMGSGIIVQDIDGNERRITLRTFGKLYKRPSTRKTNHGCTPDTK
jgi:hypothetical protein